MIGVALACLAVALAVFVISMRTLAKERREHARQQQAWATERARLIDQMCNLADKPWTPPPAAREPVHEPPERAPDPDDALVNW